jgi:hypothetical protein
LELDGAGIGPLDEARVRAFEGARLAFEVRLASGSLRGAFPFQSEGRVSSFVRLASPLP